MEDIQWWNRCSDKSSIEAIAAVKARWIANDAQRLESRSRFHTENTKQLGESLMQSAQAERRASIFPQNFGIRTLPADTDAQLYGHTYFSMR